MKKPVFAAALLLCFILLAGCLQQPPQPSSPANNQNQGLQKPGEQVKGDKQPVEPSQDQRLAEQAVAQGDASLCNSISSQSKKDSCILTVADSLNDSSLCASISDHSKKNYCEKKSD